MEIFSWRMSVQDPPLFSHTSRACDHDHDQFVTMRPSHVSCSHVSGEQSDQVTDLLAVTIKITCCHCTLGVSQERLW